MLKRKESIRREKMVREERERKKTLEARKKEEIKQAKARVQKQQKYNRRESKKRESQLRASSLLMSSEDESDGREEVMAFSNSDFQYDDPKSTLELSSVRFIHSYFLVVMTTEVRYYFFLV